MINRLHEINNKNNNKKLKLTQSKIKKSSPATNKLKKMQHHRFNNHQTNFKKYLRISVKNRQINKAKCGYILSHSF